MFMADVLQKDARACAVAALIGVRIAGEWRGGLPPADLDVARIFEDVVGATGELDFDNQREKTDAVFKAVFGSMHAVEVRAIEVASGDVLHGAPPEPGEFRARIIRRLRRGSSNAADRAWATLHGNEDPALGEALAVADAHLRKRAA
jgi:hypothetical protein